MYLKSYLNRLQSQNAWSCRISNRNRTLFLVDRVVRKNAGVVYRCHFEHKNRILCFHSFSRIYTSPTTTDSYFHSFFMSTQTHIYITTHKSGRYCFYGISCVSLWRHVCLSIWNVHTQYFLGFLNLQVFLEIYFSHGWSVLHLGHLGHKLSIFHQAKRSGGLKKELHINKNIFGRWERCSLCSYVLSE